MQWLLLDSGSMADQCNYPSQIDMDGRMFGGAGGANTWVRPYAPPNVRANLVFAHYARFALMPKSCGFTTLVQLRLNSDTPYCYVLRNSRDIVP
ncbi:MAG: hypothetical protein BECKG1743F_GA0114225_109952 [Candidatus Kentron sp. G]|nr:MAG: hypothetical protein BECKG1743F_GA0114225_109952 [Candidatus Kentron sp. G]VFN06953.1 MAG: hypothetical protein BECKG1743E_GA0114224_110972 [Candidatus Kentron sp. G]